MDTARSDLAQGSETRLHTGASRAALRHILVALDASDHANRGLAEALRLARLVGGEVTGIHAYAAMLHNQRFRQMESGLPERYRNDAELEHQREVHDDLISRGLRIISDSYHDAARAACTEAGVPYSALSPEGKNYRRIVEAVRTGRYELLVLGALGLGAVAGSQIGTVCERVVRRSPIDVLVMRSSALELTGGPLVVGLDGSARSFAALRVGLDLGGRLGLPVHAVAVYDPYFHYVAFRRISGILSEEAGRTFRFKHQEKLHEELIDDGLAKIYRTNLDIARAIAGGEASGLICELLDGKPHVALRRYLERVGAVMVLVGKTGLHADPELDIGGTAENLMRSAPCHVWLCTAECPPPAEFVAKETIAWTAEAEQSMAHVPETVRTMVRTAIVRYASERGHTMITARVVGEATAALCPHAGREQSLKLPIAWPDEAQSALEAIADPAVRNDVRLRAERRALRERRTEVTSDDVQAFVAGAPPDWDAAALARLARVPQMVRSALKARIENATAAAGANTVTLEAVESEIDRSRRTMADVMAAGGHGKAPTNGG